MLLSPFLLLVSRCGTGYQRKFSLQLNPPQVMSEPLIYANELSSITSIMGHTAALLKINEWNLSYMRQERNVLLGVAHSIKSGNNFKVKLVKYNSLLALCKLMIPSYIFVIRS